MSVKSPSLLISSKTYFRLVLTLSSKPSSSSKSLKVWLDGILVLFTTFELTGMVTGSTGASIF
jgi:hypothetical protein